MSRGVAFFSQVFVAPAVTWNPSDKHADIALSGGNLTATKSSGDALRSVRATKGITGKGYFEVLFSNASSSPFCFVGIGTSSAVLTSFAGNDANGWGYYEETGAKYTNNVSTAYGEAYANDIIGCAFDNGKVWFSKNGVWQASGDPAAGTGAAYTGISGTVYPMLSLYKGGAAPKHVGTGRFTTGSFSYSPPSGFPAWYDA